MEEHCFGVWFFPFLLSQALSLIFKCCTFPVKNKKAAFIVLKLKKNTVKGNGQTLYSFFCFCIFEKFFKSRISLKRKISSVPWLLVIAHSLCRIPKPNQFKLLVSNNLASLCFQGALYMFVDTVKDNALCFLSLGFQLWHLT